MTTRKNGSGGDSDSEKKKLSRKAAPELLTMHNNGFPKRNSDSD